MNVYLTTILIRSNKLMRSVRSKTTLEMCDVINTRDSVPPSTTLNLTLSDTRSC